MKKDCIIIGAGIAGLSCANALLDIGIKPLLIESGSFPKDRVCGEFLSEESLPLLQKWEIHPTVNISHIKFFLHGSPFFSFTLPFTAGSISRIELESKLLMRAQNLGLELLTQTKIKNLSRHTSSKQTLIKLTNGDSYNTKSLVWGFSKPSSAAKKLYGVKAHIHGCFPKMLRMHVDKEGYQGFVPIDDYRANCAAILKSFDALTQFKETISNKYHQHIQFLECRLPEFSMPDLSAHPGEFFIAEGALSLPPITGQGLTLSLLSGILAAPFVAKNDSSGFIKEWSQKFSTTLKWGLRAHRLANFAPESYLPIRTLFRLSRLHKFLHRKTRCVF